MQRKETDIGNFICSCDRGGDVLMVWPMTITPLEVVELRGLMKLQLDAMERIAVRLDRERQQTESAIAKVE